MIYREFKDGLENRLDVLCCDYVDGFVLFDDVDWCNIQMMIDMWLELEESDV